jgi:hypothetical protein
LGKNEASRKTTTQVFQVGMREMRITEAKQTYRLQERMRLLRAQRESGLTIRAWCASNNIKESSYYYWLKETRKAVLQSETTKKPEKEQRLVRIELPSCVNPVMESLAVPAIRMQYKSAILEISPGIKVEDLSIVLKALDLV